MIGLNKIGLNQVQLNRLRLNAPFPTCRKMAGGGGSGDGFPVLPGDVTRWHFGGLTNEMMAAMDDPRIEDADGKGRFLSFKNFAWGGMSGVGGYTENYNSNKWYKAESRIDATWTYKSFNARSIKDNRLAQLFYQSSLSDTGFRVLSCTIKVSGLTDGQGIEYVSNGTQQFVIMRIENDGIYHLPSFDFGAKNAYYGFKFLKLQESCNITIEQLPLYPGFILGDGVDDFAVTEKELNFEDTYTVYTAFIPFQNNPARNMILCGADSKKTFSMQYSSLVYVSFIAGNNYYINADFVNGLNLFACKRNGNNICIKNLLTNKVVTGTCGDWVENAGLYYLWKNATYASFARAGIAGQIIDNGHFTTDEEDENILNWHKKQYPWLFPDQAWTVTGKTNEDEDRATIANITGNGNDLVLSNFGFAEGSGYGLYAQNYISYAITNRAVYTKTNSSIHVTKSITAGVNFTESARDVTIPSYRIKVTGIQSGQEMIYRGSNNTFLTNIPSDGIYVLPAVENGSNLGFQFVSYTGDCDITIEQIPEYEGYLITDGVDDEIISAKLIQFADKFTIVGDWKFMEDRNDNAGLLKANQIYIYNATTGMRIYLKQGSKNYPFSCKKINALTSDGWVYDEKWDKYKVYPIGSDIDISSRLFLGFYSSNFTKIALKNLGIYNDQLLSKDDCIKAYNYLQTLKAK
ncbi:MAG: hypothetical protein ACLT13_18115 [Parabacteroides merdae]